MSLIRPVVAGLSVAVPGLGLSARSAEALAVGSGDAFLSVEVTAITGGNALVTGLSPFESAAGGVVREPASFSTSGGATPESPASEALGLALEVSSRTDASASGPDGGAEGSHFASWTFSLVNDHPSETAAVSLSWS